MSNEDRLKKFRLVPYNVADWTESKDLHPYLPINMRGPVLEKLQGQIILGDFGTVEPHNVARIVKKNDNYQHPGPVLTRMSLFAGLFLSPEKVDDFLDLQAELYRKRAKQHGVGWARAYYIAGILRSLPPVIWSAVRKILVEEIFSLGK